MKGYLIDAQNRTIHLVEVGSLKSATKLISPNCEELMEVVQFSNGDAVFADAVGFYNENPHGTAQYMGLIVSDMFWSQVRPFWSRLLVLGCSRDSVDCNYNSNCDVRSSMEKIEFWTKFFPAEEGRHWLDYNYMIDM